MPTARSRTLGAQLALSLLLVVLVGLGARVGFSEDVLFAFSLQSLMLCLGFLLLRQPWRTIAVVLYLGLGIAGLPLFKDGGSGWAHFSGDSLGFFIGFVLASFIPVRASDFQQTTTYAVMVHGVLLLCGSIAIAIREVSLGFGWELFQYLLPGAVIKSLLLGLLVWAYRKWISPR